MAGILSMLFGGGNKALQALNPMNQIISKSIPGLQGVLDRKEMIGGNPLKPVGDTITRGLGGDPDASVLDMVGGQQIPPYLPNSTNIFGSAMNDMSDKPLSDGIGVNTLAPRPETPLPTQLGNNEIGVNTLTPRPNIPLPTQPEVETGGNIVAPTLVKEPSPAEKLRVEIDRRNSKDFRKGGKDYDDDHNFKDVLRSAGIAALKGLATNGIGGGIGGAIAGAIGGAVDRNADEKMGNEIALGRLIPKYKEAYNIEEQRRRDDEQSRLRKAQATNAEMQPVFKQGELERKTRKDQMTDKYNELRIKLGQQKADDWRWAQEQLDAYRDGTLKVSEERLKQYQRIIEETERNNLRLDADRDRGLDIKQQTATNTANNNAATQERLNKTLQSADENKKNELLLKSLERWQKNNPGATPEDVAAAEAAIRKTIYGQ